MARRVRRKRRQHLGEAVQERVQADRERGQGREVFAPRLGVGREHGVPPLGAATRGGQSKPERQPQGQRKGREGERRTWAIEQPRREQGGGREDDDDRNRESSGLRPPRRKERRERRPQVVATGPNDRSDGDRDGDADCDAVRQPAPPRPA